MGKRQPLIKVTKLLPFSISRGPDRCLILVLKMLIAEKVFMVEKLISSIVFV